MRAANRQNNRSSHMNFKLEKVSANAALVKYHITNSTGELVGSVNVKPKDEAALLKHWSAPQEAAPAAKAAGKAGRSKEAIVAALKRGPKLSKAALLRS